MIQKRESQYREGYRPETKSATRRPETAERGRVCEALGCTTGLSIYNPGNTCHIHAGPQNHGGGPRRRR